MSASEDTEYTKRPRLENATISVQDATLPKPPDSVERHEPSVLLEPEAEQTDKMGLPPLRELTVDKVLYNSAKTKSLAVAGTFSSKPEACAVVLAEKQPLTEVDVRTLFSSVTSLSQSFQNDIYGQYIASCSNGIGTVKLQTVFPATDAHIRKYSVQPSHLILESPADYEEITKPFIEKKVMKFEWVFNILEGRAEADRVVHDDPDPVDGFILLPDMKWDQSDVESLYMLAIVRRRGLACMRDLTAEHLPLLKNLLVAGKKAINERYGLPMDQIRTYLHYPPSYYHLHVHFTHLSYEAPKTTIGQSHLLEDVIDNIENVSGSYYARRTIPCVLREGSPLWEHFTKHREELGS